MVDDACKEITCLGLELRAARESAKAGKSVKLFQTQLSRWGLSDLVKQVLNVLLLQVKSGVV